VPKASRYVSTRVNGRLCTVPRWVFREWAEGGLRQLIRDFGLERNYANPVEEEAMRNINLFSYALRRFYLASNGVRPHLTPYERNILQAERIVMNKNPHLSGNDLRVAMCDHLRRRGIPDIFPWQLQGILYDLSRKMIILQAAHDSRQLIEDMNQWHEAAQALIDEEMAAEL